MAVRICALNGGHFVFAQMSDGSCYLMGEQFTTADILLTTCLTWAVDYGVPISESATGFLRRIAARSGYVAALKANFVEDFDGVVRAVQ